MTDDASGGDTTRTDASSDRSDGDRGRGPDVDVETVATYLRWGAILGLSVLAIVAAAGLYGSLSAIIDVWIADRYQPFARAALNFGVLCGAGAGIVLLLRRQ